MNGEVCAMLDLMTSQEMTLELERVFTPPQTASLVRVLTVLREPEVQRAADTQALKQGLTTLTGEVRQLAEAQRHTDRSVGALTDAQKQTDQRVAELAVAQRQTTHELAELSRHTDQRFAEMAEAQRQMVREMAESSRQTDQRFAEMAEGQRQMAREMAESSRRTDQRFVEMAEGQREMQRAMATLAQGLQDLRQQVGSLANTFGFSLEEFVAALLPPYLARHYGVTDLTLERRHFELGDGARVEVDLTGEGLRHGQPVTVLAECQATLGGGGVRDIARYLEPVLATLAGVNTLVVIVAMNIHPSAHPVAGEFGIQLIPYSRINRERE